MFFSASRRRCGHSRRAGAQWLVIYYRVVDRAVRAANRRIRLQCSLASAADLRAAADSGLRGQLAAIPGWVNRRAERRKSPSTNVSKSCSYKSSIAIDGCDGAGGRSLVGTSQGCILLACTFAHALPRALEDNSADAMARSRPSLTLSRGSRQTVAARAHLRRRASMHCSEDAGDSRNTGGPQRESP